MDTLNTALFWLNQGIATVPLYSRSKIPAVKWVEFKSRLPSPQLIQSWYQEPRNIALVTGWQNLIVIEWDVPEFFACWYVWQLDKNPDILNTYRVTSARGIHYYFYLTEPVRLNTLQGSLFEIKSSGKLCTTPPSVHKSGHVYAGQDDPTNIRVVKPEQILNYSAITLHSPIVFLTRSKYAPVSDTGRESSIEAIKAGVSILNFLPTAKPVDAELRYYRGDCPFHGHKNNFWIDKKLNTAGCFAFCTGAKALSIVDFYMLLNSCDLRNALAELERYL